MKYYVPMDMKVRSKSGLAAAYKLCPFAHFLALLSGAVILLHLVTRGNRELMTKLASGLVRPLHGWLATLCAGYGGSVAELVIYTFSVSILIYTIFEAARIVRGGRRLVRAYRLVMSLLALGLFVYALFCLMWGVYYYGDDFETASGLEAGAISTEQLETVTAYFAALSNDFSRKVPRDGSGRYDGDRIEILSRSSEVYDNIVEKFPCLAGPKVDVKPFALSRLMSYTDFTGFFFPFTGEANVNMDFPPALFPSTVAHELAHQRGVAKEQEANFAAVLASLAYGDADYCYSACLLAYTHLGNALYRADREAWREIYESLDENVMADFAAAREYWAQFETPVQELTNSVYEGFLQSYGQKLGMKSYGACVDLLVNYYYGDALEYLNE